MKQQIWSAFFLILSSPLTGASRKKPLFMRLLKNSLGYDFNSGLKNFIKCFGKDKCIFDPQIYERGDRYSQLPK